MIQNLTVTGGQYGIDASTNHDESGSQPSPNVVGLTLSGQTVAGVIYSGRQTLALVGFDISVPAVPSGLRAIQGQGGEGSSGAILGTIALIDGEINFASEAGAHTAIDTQSSIYVKNLYCRHCDTIVATQQNSLINNVGQSDGWTLIDEYAQGINPAAYTASGWSPNPSFKHTRYEGLVRTTAGNDLIERGADDTAPSVDLVARHLPTSFPHFTSANINATDVPYNAAGNFVTDDTVAIQNALNAATAGQTVFLPKGIYRITDTLDIPEDVNLIGVHRTLTVIVADIDSFNNATAELPLIQTTDSATSSSKLGYVHLWAQKDAVGSYAFNWRAGEGVIQGVNGSRFSQYGFGAYPGKVASPADAEFPFMLFSGNAGGKVYGLHMGETGSQGVLYRHFMFSGTSNPLSVYTINGEHALGETNIEIDNSENIDLYSLKSESNYPALWVRDSDNINAYGHGGLGAALDNESYPVAFEGDYTPTLYRIERTTNWRLVGLIDHPWGMGESHPIFGEAQDPNVWKMVMVIEVGQATENLTPALDRPILMRSQ